MTVKKAKYYRIIFQAGNTDLKGVKLSLNGRTLVIPKETEVIIPAIFKECADRLEEFSYNVIGGASEKEYKAQVKYTLFGLSSHLGI